MRPLSRDRTWRLRASVSPNFFSMPAPAARFFVDSGMTQRGACRYSAGPNGFCDPASRQVCLCQRSARRPRSTYPGWTDTVRVSCVVSPSRRHRSPVQRAPSIDTRTPGTRANLSHIADITRRARVSPAMNSSPIRDVRTKSRQRLSDLCHMRDARKSRKKKRQDFLPLSQ